MPGRSLKREALCFTYRFSRKSSFAKNIYSGFLVYRNSSKLVNFHRRFEKAYGIGTSFNPAVSGQIAT